MRIHQGSAHIWPGNTHKKNPYGYEPFTVGINTFSVVWVHSGIIPTSLTPEMNRREKDVSFPLKRVHVIHAQPTLDSQVERPVWGMLAPPWLGTTVEEPARRPRRWFSTQCLTGPVCHVGCLHLIATVSFFWTSVLGFSLWRTPSKPLMSLSWGWSYPVNGRRLPTDWLHWP